MFDRVPRALIFILLVTAFLRFYNLWYPQGYVFDEVYHGFTAREYAKGNRDAWNPWAKPPAGVAYEWLHPPVAKEIMASSIWLLHTTDAWAYRLPGAILGVVSVYLVYLLGRKIFENERIGLISAFVFSVDGLNFVQSRTGMNDIYLVTFSLASTLLFMNKRYLLSALLLGLALSSKWPGIFLLPVFGIFLLINRQLKYLSYFLLVPVAIYLLSYTPYFLQGYSFNDLIELHRQIWQYQTHLKATHDYASAWWSWPFNLYPVWYYVDYHQNGTISNIFASGNPVMFLFGVLAVVASIWEVIEKRTKSLQLPLLGYFIFFTPWVLSPRIMFLYHYSPSVPFMALLLGYQIENLAKNSKGGRIFNYRIKYRDVLIICLGLIGLGFIFIYPVLTGVPLPKSMLNLFFRSNLTKDPFGL